MKSVQTRSSIPRWFPRTGAILITAGILGGAVWYFAHRLPPIPRRPLRIGFEPNAPLQIKTESGFGGLAVDTVES